METEEKKSKENIMRKKADIVEMDNNIKAQLELKNARNNHLSYYTGMLATNNARGGSDKVTKTGKGAGRASNMSQNRGQKPNEQPVAGMMSTGGFSGIRGGKSVQQMAFHA